MGNYRLRKVAHRLITGMALLTIVITTFWTGTQTPTRAASAVDTGSDQVASYTPASTITNDAPQPASYVPAALAPMDAMVIVSPDRLATLEKTITRAGGYVYVQQGNALFVGLNDLTPDDLIPAGAVAVYQNTVPDSEIAALSADDRAAASVWNQVVSDTARQAQLASISGDAPSSVIMPTDRSRAESVQAVPTLDQQTSDYMVGNVAVRVLFVESTGVGTENWTEVEIGKVKTEIVQALDWWTTAATAPLSYGGDPRPAANLEWLVSYVSPFEGTSEDRLKIQVPYEPITLTTVQAATDNGWMSLIAQHFFPAMPANGTTLRTLADGARDAAGADWGFTLFVVDSGADTDGLFQDDKAAGAALNGPYAFVSSDGGNLTTENLEILIAKMVGHVFGAGDESYNPNTPSAGCRPDEVYGYFRVEHTNCEFPDGVANPSLMRSGQNMIDAYRSNSLSIAARQQVGWYDADNDGFYDVTDTLTDTFAGLAADPACPVLHIANQLVDNADPVPSDVGDTGDWSISVWNNGSMEEKLAFFIPVNINWIGYVWGRIGTGEWIAAAPAGTIYGETRAWTRDDDGYTLYLPGRSGALNRVQIAIMNRWEQQTYLTENPVNISVLGALNQQAFYETNDDESFGLYGPTGNIGVGSGWSFSPLIGAHGNATMLNSTFKSEACFAFAGREATLYYSNQSDGVADVYVDGERHSTIRFTPTMQTQVKHVITNLATGIHVVRLEVVSGVVDFDAVQLTSSVNDATQIIDTLPVGSGGEIPNPAAGFYEDSEDKLRYVGTWTVSELPVGSRPGPAADSTAKRSSNAYDRFYFVFRNADAVAIYRSVYPGGGSAQVYVDGEEIGTMYNDAAVARVMPFYIGGLLASSVHTVEVRINPNTPYFELASLRFRQLETEDFAPKSLYTPASPGVPLDVAFNGAQDPNNGTWTTKTSFLESKERGAVLTMFFKGAAVAVNVGTGSSDGLLEMYVDGRLMRTVDTKAASSKDQPIIAHGFNSAVPHVLQVRQINANPAKPKVIQIYGYTVYTFEAVGPGTYEEYQYSPAGVPTQSPFVYEQSWKNKLITKIPGPSDGHFMESGHDQARAYLYFQGVDSLTIYATAGSYGAADVYVNNEFQGTFTLKRSTTAYQAPFTLTGLDAEEINVLELRINTTLKLPKKISLDKVVLYNKPKLSERVSAYENNEIVSAGGTSAPALQFTGQWTDVANTLASGGTFEMSSAIADQVVFDVTGATSVVITRRLYSKYGMVEVYVDNELYGVFDSFTSSPATGAFQEHYVIAGLDPDFDHTIRLSAQRSGKKLDKFKPFDIDAVLVRSGDVAGENFLEEGLYQSNDANIYKLGGGGAVDYLGASWVTGNPALSEPSTATVKGDKAIVLFKGDIFRVYVNMSSTSGKALVYIDSQLMGTIDSKNGTVVTEVPFTFVGLTTDLHTAEIIVQGRFTISAYEVLTAVPSPAGDYATAPTNPAVYRSGLWTENAGVLETKQMGASLFFYVADVDSLNVRHKVISTTGDIEVYVNKELHSTIDATYIKTKLPATTSDYLVSGLSTATTEGGWIEIRNPKAKLIGISNLQALDLVNHLTDTSPIESEAETPGILQTSGLWDKKPATADTVKYLGGYYMETRNNFGHFYIPVQFLSYVTIYRPLTSGYGDAKVYIDGVYWGTMPNSAASAQYQVPFSIGPIPDPATTHIIELRAASKKKFAVDKIVGYGMEYIDPGYYEDTSPVFIGTTPGHLFNEKAYAPAYSGTWKVITDAAASDSSLHQTTKRGSRLSAVFYGNQLTVYRRVSSAGKTMILYVDGVAYRISNQSSVKTNRVPHTILLSDDGPHSFELVADSGQLDFDAVEIKNVLPATKGAYQQDSVYVALNGTWTTVAAPDINSGDAYSSTKQKYASAFFLFSGTQVTTYLTTGKDWGIMSVYLDGVFKSDVNLYLYDKVTHPKDEPFYKFDVSDLEDTTHVLELRFEGKKDKKGKPVVNFDAITVDNYPVPKPGEHVLPEDTGGEPTVPMVGCYEDFITADSPWTWFSSAEFGWVQTNSKFASGQFHELVSTWTYHYTNGNTGDLIYTEFNFMASGFSLMYVKYPSGGQAKLYVDGVPLNRPASPGGLISMYTPVIDGLWRENAIYTADGFDPDVPHVLRIEWLNYPVGSRIYIDRIDLPVYDPTCDPPEIP